MRRPIGFMLGALIVLWVMASSNGAAAVALDYWGALGASLAEVEREIFEAFHEASGRRYEVANALPMGAGTIEQRLPVAVAAGAPPHVVRPPALYLASFAAMGLLQPLDDLIERDGFDLSEFFPVGIGNANWQGRMYAIPLDIDTRAVFYNASLFREVGLDPDNPPRTWEEVDIANRALDRFDANGVPVQLGLVQHYGNWFFEGWLRAAGGELIDATGRRITWNSPEGVRALSWMDARIRQLGGEGVIAAAWRDIGGFFGGRSGMFIQTSPYIAQLMENVSDFEWRVAFPPRPQGLEGTPISWSGGQVLAIPVGVTGAEREAAWEFIKFRASQWAQKLVAVRATQMPTHRSAATDPDFLGLHPENAKLVELMSYSLFRPQNPFWTDLVTFSRTNVMNMLTAGNTSPEAILATTAEQAQAFLDQKWAELDASN